MTKTLYASTIHSPAGPLLGLVDRSGAVVRIELPRGRSEAEMRRDLAAEGYRLEDDPRRTAELHRQLEEYFAGRRTSFDLPLAPAGSPFQRSVWTALATVPFGGTASYGDIARAIGRPGAARAVGRANATNPIPIVVPCHRVIGADGSLTGYGGGLEMKETLLALEGRA